MSDAFDYVVVGGGSAGAIVAARLSEDPKTSVCLLEWGDSDVNNDDVLQIRRWLGLLEGPIDLAYHTTLQPRGNAHIVHSRAKVLGGCSSHNTMIWFRPFPGDWNAGPYRDGAGFLDVGYNPANGVRSSSSVMYLHPIVDSRPNLSVQTRSRAMQIECKDGRAVAVHVERDDGAWHDRVEASKEIIVCCGSVDTPRL